MTETTPSKDLQLSMSEYYQQEAATLEEAVSQGKLMKQKALNGDMYVLPMPTGDFPIAIVSRDMVIRSGDEVLLSRRSSTGRNIEARMQLSGFKINQGNNEIEFRRPPDLELILPIPCRIQEIAENLSAPVRLYTVNHNK